MTGPVAVLLVAAATLLWPGAAAARPPAPVRARPRARTTTRPVPHAEVAELFAAALESGLDPLTATRWCARPSGADTAAPAPPAPIDTVDDVLAWWDERVPAVARALAVADRLGSPAAPAVRTAAEGERRRAEADADLRSGLAGVRVTAWLLTALPVLGAALAVTTTPPSGAALAAMAAGALLTALGWWLLHLLVARVSAGARA